MNKLSKTFIVLGAIIAFVFGQALFVIPDLCRPDGSLTTCFSNGIRVLVMLLVAIIFILLAIYFKKND